MTSLKRLKLLDCTNLFSNNPKLFVPSSVEDLEFAKCNITGKQLSDMMLNLPVLKTLKLGYCKGITSLAVEMLVDEQNLMDEGRWHVPPHCLMTLEKLHISFRGLPDSSMLFLSKKGLGGFESLKELSVTNGDTFLSSMISEATTELPNCSLLPPSLLELYITDVEDKLLVSSKLSSLVEMSIRQSPVLTCLQLRSCTVLRKLHIKECGMLQSIQGLQSLSFLAELEIDQCSKLASVQLRSCMSLQFLTIERCDALCMLDGPHSLSALKEVRICTNASLASVELHSCTMLEKLCVKECPKLASWQVFESLVGLKYLQVSECPGFVSSWVSAAEEIEREGHMFSMPLKQLDIDDRSVLTMPICCQITALETLIITGVHHLYDEVGILMDSHEAALSVLVSLKDLTFSSFKGAQSLPATLRCLRSLHSLTIHNCPGINSLPEEGLPPSLVQMDLYNAYSSELSELCYNMSEEQGFLLYTNGQEA
uniref:Uncharacterized protein n=1 Tax=Arundo donax TaxID=35708 RepID=A0A0A9H2M1_ARUDO